MPEPRQGAAAVQVDAAPGCSERVCSGDAELFC